MTKKPMTLAMAMAMAVSLSLIGASVADAKSGKIKYAKSELDKAVGKCVLTVLGGTILGGLVAGKKNRAAGALGGAAVGGIFCALIVNDAKKKDRIYEAQLAAARSANGRFTLAAAGDDGQAETYTAIANSPRTVMTERLMPVRVKMSDGIVHESPVLPGPDAICRDSEVSAKLADGSSFAAPSQLMCRSEDGDWYAYQINKSGSVA